LPGAVWNNGKIVFASTREPHDEIYVIAEDGHSGEEIKITNRLNKVAYEPSLSPDGEWVVFESHILDIEDNGIITKYKINGSSSYLELTNPEEDCRQPNWSPEGNKILYQKRTNGQWHIWIMNTDGSNKIKITNNIGNCTDASFSSDGQSIIFSSDYQVSLANIYTLSIDGTNLTKLTAFDGYDGATSISTDGKNLTFESSNEDPDDSSGTKIAILKLN
jgi:TolB protein